MARIILTFGIIAGLIVSLLMVIGMTLMAGPDGVGSSTVGYLTMLLALAFIFVAVKRHRDVNLGGVIRFWPALGVGLGVSAVAGLFYVVTWEIYFELAGDTFIEGYMAGQIETRRENGATAAELVAYEASLEESMALYAQRWFRMPISFTEIFPVGVLVSLVSAAILRNPRVLPRRA